MVSFQINKGRLFFIYFCVFLGFFAVAARLIFVVTFSEEVDLKKIYDGESITRRGNIVDRNGIMIATDIDVKVLYANSDLIRDPAFVAQKISQAFPELNRAKLLKRLSKKNREGWIFIKRNITPRQEQIINDLGIAGLIFENSKTRIYPQKASFSHVVGYTDSDGNGIAGIEKQYDEFLKKGDKDLKLALDVRIQDILNYELENAIVKYKASAAIGIVMDAKNGEIIALASLPNFDLNNQSVAGWEEKFNRATYGVYEFGSVFKIFNHAHAFEDNLVKKSNLYSVRDPIRFGRFAIDDDHKDKEVLTLEEVFTHSSNIGSVKIAQLFGPKSQKEFLGKLGLLDKIESDFPSLGKPLYPKQWSDISLATISFGHGIAVTPLHIVRAVAAVLNGKLLTPSFIKLTEEPDSKKVISDKTSVTMRDLLRKVVVEGTGRNAEVEGYKIGGKTGTAETAESGGYNKGKNIASFVASFPMDKPRYVIFVGIDKPNYIFNTGGMVAAPVTGEVIKSIAPILGDFYN